MADGVSSSTVNLDVFSIEGGNGQDGLRVNPESNTHEHTSRLSRVNLRIVTFATSAGQRTKAFLTRLKRSVAESVPKSGKGWIRALSLVIFVLLMIFGILAFILSVLERKDLQHIRRREPMLMYDGWLSMINACTTVLANATMIIIAGLLGVFGSFSHNRLILMLHVVFLSMGLLPLLYRGFGRDLVHGLPESISKSHHTQLSAKHDLLHHYGFDDRCSESDRSLCTTAKWDSFQANRQCCGISRHGGRIYKFSKWYQHMREGFNSTIGNNTEMEYVPFVPLSCCVRLTSGEYVDVHRCQATEKSNEYRGARYEVACDDAQADVLRHMQIRLSAVCWVISLISILLIIVTFVRYVPQDL